MNVESQHFAGGSVGTTLKARAGQASVLHRRGRVRVWRAAVPAASGETRGTRVLHEELSRLSRRPVGTVFVPCGITTPRQEGSRPKAGLAGSSVAPFACPERVEG